MIFLANIENVKKKNENRSNQPMLAGKCMYVNVNHKKKSLDSDN